MSFHTSSGEIQNMFSQVIEQYQPGGAFEQKELGVLKRKKKLAMAKTYQEQVSRGLAGTTVPMANAPGFEEEVGVPVRTAVEGMRAENLTQAMLQEAGYLSRERAGIEQRQAEQRGERLIAERQPVTIGRVEPGTTWEEYKRRDADGAPGDFTGLGISGGGGGGAGGPGVGPGGTGQRPWEAPYLGEPGGSELDWARPGAGRIAHLQKQIKEVQELDITTFAAKYGGVRSKAGVIQSLQQQIAQEQAKLGQGAEQGQGGPLLGTGVQLGISIPK